MRKRLYRWIFLLLPVMACRDDAGTPPPCVQPPFAYTLITTAADSCSANGTLSLNGGGNSYQYRVNDGPFQNAPLFVGLLPGKYRLGIKGPDCIYTDTVTVPAAAPGPYFTQARLFINQYCISCHNPANLQAGIDFTQSCTIVRQANRIMARAFFGNPSPMPATGLLPLGERNKISVWYGQGAKFTD